MDKFFFFLEGGGIRRKAFKGRGGAIVEIQRMAKEIPRELVFFFSEISWNSKNSLCSALICDFPGFGVGQAHRRQIPRVHQRKPHAQPISKHAAMGQHTKLQ